MLKKSIKFKLLLTALFCIISLTILSGPVMAQTNQLLDSGAKTETERQNEAFQQASGFTGTNDVYSLSRVVASVIRTVLSLLGVIFIVLIIYAGFLWMTSAGNEEKVTKAKNIMSAAVIGLVIVLSAYAITVFVIDKLVGSGVSPGGSHVTSP